MQQLKPNTTLQGGKYRIERVLGQGGFGITYKAVMKEKVSGSLGAIDVKIPVAIKEFFMSDSCMRSDDSGYVTVPSTGSKTLVEQYRKKFVKEAKNLSMLSHPNIVKVIDVFQENGTDYYVMEYLEGGSLRDLVKKNGPLSESVAIKYITSVGNALSYMHTMKHMCHLDVKPSNILIDKDGNAKLIDFGISKSYDNEGNQTSSTPVGISKGFAPLEQYQQAMQDFSPQTDIYALGATLYYLLTGVVPPEASIVFNDGLPDLPSSISWNTRNAIEKAMQPRKKERPQRILDFIQFFNDERVTIEDIDDSEETFVINQKPEKVLEPTIPKKEVKQKDFKQETPKSINGLQIGLFIIASVLMVILGRYLNNALNPRNDIDYSNDDPSLYGETETETIVQNIIFNSGIGVCTYSGPVDKNNLPDGDGTAKFQDGRLYIGSFINGVMDGKATFYYGNGDTFEGTFKNNSFYEGKYTIKSDGSYFQGTFKNGQPDQGNWYDKNGKMIQ